MPGTCWLEFHCRRMSCSIVLRYSGQQKSDRLISPPLPPQTRRPTGPPRSRRPPYRPSPFPSSNSGPRVGVRPRASGGVVSTSVSGSGRGAASSTGRIISGGAGVGGWIHCGRVPPRASAVAESVARRAPSAHLRPAPPALPAGWPWQRLERAPPAWRTRMPDPASGRPAPGHEPRRRRPAFPAVPRTHVPDPPESGMPLLSRCAVGGESRAS